MTVYAHAPRCGGGILRRASIALSCVLYAAHTSAAHALPLASWMYNASQVTRIAQCNWMAPASETPAMPNPEAITKTVAILGGAPSRLAAMAAQQGAAAVAPAALPLSYTASPASLSSTDCPAPFGNTAPMTMTPAQQVSPSPAVLLQEIKPQEGYKPAGDAPADLSKPNVFGSIANAISRTPFDSEWTRVRFGQLSGGNSPWASVLREARTQSQSAKIDTINRWVNARVQFTDDTPRRGSRRADRWKSASATLIEQRGDCEDYAIAKMKLLEAAGVSQRDLFLVVAYDMVRRADHALLVVRDQDRLVVLDNNTNRLVDASQIRDYRPLMSYSGGNSWVHGYRRNKPGHYQVAAASAPMTIFR